MHYAFAAFRLRKDVARLRADLAERVTSDVPAAREPDPLQSAEVAGLLRDLEKAAIEHASQVSTLRDMLENTLLDTLALGWNTSGKSTHAELVALERCEDRVRRHARSGYSTPDFYRDYRDRIAWNRVYNKYEKHPDEDEAVQAADRAAYLVERERERGKMDRLGTG